MKFSTFQEKWVTANTLIGKILPSQRRRYGMDSGTACQPYFVQEPTPTLSTFDNKMFGGTEA